MVASAVGSFAQRGGAGQAGSLTYFGARGWDRVASAAGGFEQDG